MNSKITVVVAIVILLIVASGSYLLLSKKGSYNNQASLTQTVASPTPTPITNVTTQNSDQALQQTDSDIQTSLNQMDNDFNSLNQIDTTQDSSSTGL
jgi:hypothetical protein